MPRCVIINCHGAKNVSTEKQGHISYHSFPHDPIIKEKWIAATGRKNWFPTKHSTICSIHFENTSFIGGKKLRLLKKTAYPTIDVLKLIDNDDELDDDTNTLSDDSDSETPLVAPQHSTQSESAPKRKREELAPPAADRLEPVRANVEPRARRKTEFDVFCEGVALQLNSMPLADALRLQLELQTLVTQRRLQSLQGQQTSPLLPKTEPSSSCGSSI